MRLVDVLAPRSETLQIRLKKKGSPTAGLFVGSDGSEVRSKALDEVQEANDQKPPHRR